MVGECTGNVRSTPTALNEILRTVNVSRSPPPWRRITTPWNIWMRSRLPSTTRTCTFTVSPGRNSGRSVRRRAVSMRSTLFMGGYLGARPRALERFDDDSTRPRTSPGEPRGLLALVHPPLHELGSAAVGHEPDLPHVDERPRVRVGGVRVDGPSPDERRVAVDALDLVLERPRAGIVLASEPLAHDLLAPVPGLPEGRREVVGVVGEQRADLLGVVRTPRGHVPPDPFVHTGPIRHPGVLLLRREQIRPVPPGLGERRLAAPPFHLAVVPGDEHVRHPQSAKLLRPRVVRMVEEAGLRERVLLHRLAPPDHTGHEPGHGLQHDEGRDLAARQHVVADRVLLGREALDDPLV